MYIYIYIDIHYDIILFIICIYYIYIYNIDIVHVTHISCRYCHTWLPGPWGLSPQTSTKDHHRTPNGHYRAGELRTWEEGENHGNYCGKYPGGKLPIIIPGNIQVIMIGRTQSQNHHV